MPFAPAVVTEADAGRTCSLPLGSFTSLQLSRGPYRIVAERVGRSVVRVGGESGCEERDGCPAEEVVLTFDVVGGDIRHLRE